MATTETLELTFSSLPLPLLLLPQFLSFIVPETILLVYPLPQLIFDSQTSLQEEARQNVSSSSTSTSLSGTTLRSGYRVALRR